MFFNYVFLSNFYTYENVVNVGEVLYFMLYLEPWVHFKVKS